MTREQIAEAHVIKRGVACRHRQNPGGPMVYLTRRLVESAKRSPILLTGSSGYLGTELSEQLRLAGVEFTGVDREPGS
ncbi:uncharacterized protein METZ01_LOCUS313385, partial [marine metagenome]